ncbi:MAG: hypothetical protein HQK54_14170 [Oligoflexales bacterium]|nr:hypothetical protein [Oligoflexales bacterium]
MISLDENEFIYTKEYWTGDSRDGNLINGDGYHYYKMSRSGKIFEAYEWYEQDDGVAVVSPLPEMKDVDWIKDLGFEDMEVLDQISKLDFEAVKKLAKS